MSEAEKLRLKVSQELDILIVGFYRGTVSSAEIEIKRLELEQVVAATLY